MERACSVLPSSCARDAGTVAEALASDGKRYTVGLLILALIDTTWAAKQMVVQATPRAVTTIKEGPDD